KGVSWVRIPSSPPALQGLPMVSVCFLPVTTWAGRAPALMAIGPQRLARGLAHRSVERIGDAVADIATSRHHALLAAEQGAGRGAVLEIVDQAPRIVLRVAGARNCECRRDDRKACQHEMPHMILLAGFACGTIQRGRRRSAGGVGRKSLAVCS